MRIAFDATAILGPFSKNRGIGNYSMGLFTTMINNDLENDYFFFNLFDKDFCLQDYLNKKAKITEDAFYCGPDNFLLTDRNLVNLIGNIIKKYIIDNKIDIFYITSPFDDHNVLYQKEWFNDCQVIAIVYDIIPIVFKEHYLADANSYKYYMRQAEMLRWVDQIQVISQSAKDDLISYLNFSADNIEVIWGAVDQRYKEQEIDDVQWHTICQKFGINSKYIMCTGGDDERKNIAGLIEAYGKMPKQLTQEYQLVIVCKLSQYAVIRYTEIAEQFDVKDRVVLTNFVSNEELLCLYNKAILMAFPSIYEGFGLPIVEAWACGTPVLTANNSSLVQIAGDGAVLVDAKDISDITRGLTYALTECDLSNLLEKGKKRLELFQWDKVAADSIAAAQKLYAIRKTQNRDSKRGKIAFFTPLPPIESGISDYSVDILNNLKEYYDIDVYIDDGYETDVSFEKNISVKLHKEFAKHYKEYKDCIYQVGNSMYHVYMYDYIHRYSGIVVLHDYNMHGVFAHNALSEGKNNYKLYKKYLQEDYDETQINEYINQLKNGQCGYKIYEWDLNGYIANHAKKIIVHSFTSKSKLLERDIHRNVHQIWHYCKINDNIANEEKRLIKQQKGLDCEHVLIGVFGHIHTTKRAIPILKAVARLQKDYDNIDLVYVGKMSEEIEQDFNQTLKTFNLQNTQVTGYTTLEEFQDYINITDICLNLRYPYNGETSGSLVRNLAAGNVVITNNIGSFGEIPDNVCIKLPDVADISNDEEITYIYQALKKCIENPEFCQSIKSAAKKFAKETLDINQVVKEYIACIETPSYDVIDENMINYLSDRMRERNASENELKSLSATLAWIKEIPSVSGIY